MNPNPVIEALRIAIPNGPWTFVVYERPHMRFVEERSFRPDQWEDAQLFTQSRVLAGLAIAGRFVGTEEEIARQVRILAPVFAESQR